LAVGLTALPRRSNWIWGRKEWQRGMETAREKGTEERKEGEGKEKAGDYSVTPIANI